MKGQRQAIFNHLKAHCSITSKEAYELYGCTRLAAVIHDFRAMGYSIDTVDVHGKNRFGNPVVYGKYIMADEGKSKL